MAIEIILPFCLQWEITVTKFQYMQESSLEDDQGTSKNVVLWCKKVSRKIEDYHFDIINAETGCPSYLQTPTLTVVIIRRNARVVHELVLSKSQIDQIKYQIQYCALSAILGMMKLKLICHHILSKHKISANLWQVSINQ